MTYEITLAKRSKRARIKTWVVNFLAFVGAMSLIAFASGLVYSKFFYQGLIVPDSRPEKVEQVERFGIELPPEFVTAELGMLPPLSTMGASIMKVSMVDTVNKFIATPVIEDAQGEKYLVATTSWLEKANLGYKCEPAEPKLSVSSLDVNSITVVACIRPLREIETRVSGFPRAYTIYYLLARGDKSILVQHMMPEESKARALQKSGQLLETFIWLKP